MNEVSRADQHRANRRAQPLGQAERHRIHRLTKGGQRQILGDGGVEQPGAVKMDQQPGVVTGLGQRRDPRLWLNLAGDGVFQAEQLGDGAVEIIGLDGLGDLRHAQAALRVDRQRPGRDTAQHGRAARLGAEDVIVGARQIFFAALAVGQQGDQVALAAAGQKEPGGLAGPGGQLGFQPIERRVFPIDIVADHSFGHGLAHAGAGAGYRVAAQVNDSAVVRALGAEFVHTGVHL